MDPLQAVPMPTHGVLVGLTALNTWQNGSAYMAYIATNSTQSLSFVSLHSAANAARVQRLASRRAVSPDYQYGVVVELHLAETLADGEAIFLSLAQSGATTYYPPQPIQD